MRSGKIFRPTDSPKIFEEPTTTPLKIKNKHNFFTDSFIILVSLKNYIYNK